MTKSDLVDILDENFPQLLFKDAELAVEIILGCIENALASGDRVEIRGFGSFGLNYRLPRLGRNPKTGEAVSVPAKAVPHFKPGKELRQMVNSKSNSS